PVDLMALLAAQEGTGDLRAYQPSLRDRVGNFVYDKAQGAGLKSTANRMRSEAQTAVDFVPGLGDLIGVDDAASAMAAGNYGTAAAGLGLSALGLVPGAGDALSGAARKGIRAFHGSPHDFDRFSLA